MLFEIINCIKGNYTVKAEGNFPERILNIASTSGIYIYKVKRDSDFSLTFSLSRKGAQKLLGENVEGLTLTLIEKTGFPVFFKRYRKRFILITLPLLFLISTGILSKFIWRVDIDGGNKKLQSDVKEIIKENGVYIGAPKHKIDRYEIKRKSILEIDDLMWMWVDIKGTTANVKIQPRTKKPSLIKIAEPSDVISIYTGVIKKMQVYCGIPLFSEGMTVEKGQTVVSGVLRSENENIPTYYHHACADITLQIKEEKTVFIPYKTLKKEPTGNEKSVFSVNLKKNNIKFSLNSGISYADYDKIEKTVKIPFLPVSFSRTTYCEVNVIPEDTDVASETKRHEIDFLNTLREKTYDIENISRQISETENGVRVTYTAQCLVRADKEIPIITEGDQDGKNS